MSNPTEEALMKSEKFANSAADGLAKGVEEFFQVVANVD